MTSRRALFATAIFVVACLVATPSPARVRSFRAANPAIEDPGDRVIVLHGFNMVWKTAPYYPPSNIYPAPFGVPQSKSYFDERDAQLLEEHGFNVVRLGLIWKGLEPKR